MMTMHNGGHTPHGKRHTPHATRRRQIIKAHPEVAKLYGHEWRSKYICMFLLVIPQIWLAWATTELAWPAYLAVAYVFGATITQALFLAIHELAHNLVFKKASHNRYFAMVVNWPIGIPYCAAFRDYHIEHHTCQGAHGVRLSFLGHSMPRSFP